MLQEASRGIISVRRHKIKLQVMRKSSFAILFRLSIEDGTQNGSLTNAKNWTVAGNTDLHVAQPTK